MSESSRYLDAACAGNPEAFVRHLVAKAIEDAHREELGCGRVFYYYDVFRRFPADTDPATLSGWDDHYAYPDGEVGAVRSVWHGVGLIHFIRSVQGASRRRFAGCGLTIYATSSHCKAGIRDHWDRRTKTERPDEDVNVIWIGDVGRDAHMICCNDAWNWLWLHVLRATAERTREADTAYVKGYNRGWDDALKASE